MLLWIWVCRPLFRILLSVLLCPSGSRIARSYDGCIFFGNFIFHSSYTIVQSCQQYVSIPVSPHPCQCFCILVVLLSVRWCLSVVLGVNSSHTCTLSGFSRALCSLGLRHDLSTCCPILLVILPLPPPPPPSWTWHLLFLQVAAVRTAHTSPLWLLSLPWAFD